MSSSQLILPTAVRNFDVKPWDCEHVLVQISRGRLDPSPLYQRKAVWTPRDKVRLVQSVILKYPMGALTVLSKEDNYGDRWFDVIDGKQRVSAIHEFVELKQFGLSANDVRSLKDYRPVTDLVLKSALDDHPAGPFVWDDMTSVFQDRFKSYTIPVIVMEGSVRDAQNAFERMNRTVYKLERQEIRNATYAGYPVLAACKELAESHWIGFTANPLRDWGVLPPSAFARMKDVQLYAEFLHLIDSNTAQNRRDKLDAFFAGVVEGDAPGERRLKAAAQRVRRIFAQIEAIFGRGDLQEFGFRRHGEDDIYALVQAMHEANITDAALKKTTEDLRSAISAFRGLVDDAVEWIRGGKTLPQELDSPEVRLYAGSFLGGQHDSQKHRNERAAILRDIVTDISGKRDPKRQFSDYERRRIWRISPHECARCGIIVDWKDFHAGHRNAHATGGTTVIENGQVEHQECNQRAGAR